MRGVDVEEWIMTESGNGMVRTWSMLVPSLLRYLHTYPLVAALYILVVLVDTKKLEQQPRKLLEPTYTRPLVFVSVSLAGRTDTRTAVLVSISCPCHPEPMDGLIRPL